MISNALQKHLIVTVHYLESGNTLKESLYDLWNSDCTLASTLVAMKLKIDTLMYVTDSSEYTHEVLIELKGNMNEEDTEKNKI